MLPIATNATGIDVEAESSSSASAEVGDVLLSGGTSKALGLGRSSFDVDINQCLASTSWDTIVGGKQKVVLNWVCMAEFYLKNGKPELAAMAVCNTEVLKEFDSEEDCEAAHDFFQDMVEEAAVIVPNPNWEEEDERHEEYEQRIAELEAKVNAPRPTRVTREVVQQRYLSDEQRAKLEKVLEE